MYTILPAKCSKTNEDIIKELKLEEEEAEQPAPKMRRVGERTVAKKVAEKKNVDVSPPQRRKAATAAEKPKTTNEINTVLRTLPKGVSVKRNATAATSADKSPKKDKQTNVSTPSQNTRRSREATAAKEAEKIKEEPAAVSPKKSAAKSSSPGTAGSSSSLTSLPLGTMSKKFKMMIGDKKVNVQKITLSKAEAAAMAKQGRLRIKDGNIVLTNPPKPKDK